MIDPRRQGPATIVRARQQIHVVRARQQIPVGCRARPFFAAVGRGPGNRQEPIERGAARTASDSPRMIGPGSISLVELPGPFLAAATPKEKAGRGVSTTGSEKSQSHLGDDRVVSSRGSVKGYFADVPR